MSEKNNSVNIKHHHHTQTYLLQNTFKSRTCAVVLKKDIINGNGSQTYGILRNIALKWIRNRLSPISNSVKKFSCKLSP